MRGILAMAVWLVSMPPLAYLFDLVMSGFEWHAVSKAILFSYLSAFWFGFLQVWRFDFQAGNRVYDVDTRDEAVEEGMIIKFPGDRKQAQ